MKQKALPEKTYLATFDDGSDMEMGFTRLCTFLKQLTPSEVVIVKVLR